MITLILLLLSIAILLVKVYNYMFFKPPNFPPGPPRLPIVGGYIFLILLNSDHIHKALIWLCKYYKSKVIGFYFGPVPTIVANDYESVKEMLTRREFDGRPDIYAARLRDPAHKLSGIIFRESEIWRANRRFTLRHLRDWGFGKRCPFFEETIEHEISQTIDLIQNGAKYEHEKEFFKNDNVLFPNVLWGSIGNVFINLLSADSFKRENQNIIIEAAKNIMVMQSNSDDYGRLISLLPFLGKIMPNKSGYNPIRAGGAGVYEFVKNIIKEQLRTHDSDHERHMMDRYIKKMSEPVSNEITENPFNYEDLTWSCVDMVVPAFTLIAQQLAFLLQRILLYPEVQLKIQKEIDEVVGFGRYPNLNDRQNLNYTEAAIREILRHETIVPSGIPHKAMQDTTYMGYDIPNNTFMISGLYASHNDKDLWNDPEVFRPERFLDLNGKLDLKSDKSLPFGAGKRLCAGETFSRNMMFLFTAALFQKFTVSAPTNLILPNLFESYTGFVTYTKDFYVKLTLR